MRTIKKIIRQLFKLTHPGSKCVCVYCQKTYSKFMHEGVRKKVFKINLVAGGGYKKNVRCPHCLSTDRSRLLYLFFNLRTNVLKKETEVLHICPNPQVGRLLFGNKNIKYVCGALEPEHFKEFNAVRVDVTKIEFDDNRFDVVICNHVLEHVMDDLQALREIYRIVKPGGFSILQVPLALNMQKTVEDHTLTTCKQRKKAFGQSDHVRLYGLDYFDKLREVGFNVVRDNPFKNHWSDDLEKYRLDKNEDVIIGYKT
jgi:predicted SAM-dependent methyltransferase